MNEKAGDPAGLRIGILGNGSWSTAIAKILTDNHFRVLWWFRKLEDIEYLKQFRHNPRYLSSVHFDLRKLELSNSAQEVIRKSDWIFIGLPSAFLADVLRELPQTIFENKSVVSGVKGIIPEGNVLLHQYLQQRFEFPLSSYFSLTGPCHAEEVAEEKLSYLTISGQNTAACTKIARRFNTSYLRTIVNEDIWGAQYAAVLKNIYAIGAGMAHASGYGDNFLAVFISNCAREMALFNRAICNRQSVSSPADHVFMSAYLGDLLVTCYSPHSRNRTLGTMLGKGYTVKSALMELGMVAEGYYASKCIADVGKTLTLNMPIAEGIHQVLWERAAVKQVLSAMESSLL